jgi:hypothetical protein
MNIAQFQKTFQVCETVLARVVGYDQLGWVMPIPPVLNGKSFDPETIEIMNTAIVAVCTDLGLSDKTDGACEIVATRVIELMNGERDPEAIRQTVLAAIKAKAAKRPGHTNSVLPPPDRRRASSS